MSVRAASLVLGGCALLVGIGLILGRMGIIPDLLATGLSASGFAFGIVISTLIGLHAAGVGSSRGRRTSESPRVHELVEELSKLADSSLARGCLALAEARPELAGGLVRHGCEMVIRAADPGEIHDDLARRAKADLAAAERNRAHMAFGVSAAAAVAVLCVFVLLVWAMGAAIDPNGIDFALALALVCSVFGAFGIVAASPAVTDRVQERGRIQATLTGVSLQGVLAIADGKNGAQVRRLLERFLQESRGSDSKQVSAAQAA